MSAFDGRRLPDEVFQVDADRLRSGWHSDAYFVNIRRILDRLAAEGYTFQGQAIGEIEVEMQVFTRRTPFSVVVGVDEALAILRAATGYFDAQGEFIPTFDRLESVEAVHDGTLVPYDGDPARVRPVLRIRGRYRDFAVLETPILGALAEPTRIATNVYHVLEAAGGKDLLFFPARFAHYKLQAMHGYAYQLAVEAYNRRHGTASRPYISTDDQGAWWGGKGGGTMSHSLIASFLGSTEEAVLQFARVLDPAIPRVALVDFHNDCIGATLAVMGVMWREWQRRMRAGEAEAARAYKLFGVRADTSGHLRDQSIEPLGDKELDCGVNARLIWKLRQAIDKAWERWDLKASEIETAKAWCREVKIIATGGFDAEKIRRFERSQVPADIYGVGSSLLANCSRCGTSNDYTADIVRVKVDGRWITVAKAGRAPGENDQLVPVPVR